MNERAKETPPVALNPTISEVMFVVYSGLTPSEYGINHVNISPKNSNAPMAIDPTSYQEYFFSNILAKANATLYLFDYEALGLPVLESLASGTPVITNPKQGPYVVHANNPNVHFVSSYESLLDCCRLLLSHDKTKAEIISCKDSVAGFSSDIVAGNLLKILLK